MNICSVDLIYDVSGIKAIICDDNRDFILNKIMKDNIKNQTSFWIDRSWQKVSPNKELSLNMTKAKEFIKLLMHEQSKINNSTHANPQETISKDAQEKIHRFMMEFIQQKQLHNSSKKEASFIKQSLQKFDLKDCLEIWRWITEDNQNFEKQNGQQNQEDPFNINEFQTSKGYQPLDIKRKGQKNHRNGKGKGLAKLSLEDQQTIMKKSLEMVYMYQHQFRIIFNHYCKFIIKNQRKKVHTFDDVSHSLEILTIHRFMLFCRQFDIIKTLEFKKKNQHNFTINKHILLDIFKKCSHLQKYMNFEGFLVSLVNIAIKMNENFDLRSYMHIELFLNSLKVRYYEQFTKKLGELGIKYTPTQFYNCYKNILKKVVQKRKREENPNPTLFDNPYFQQYENSTIFHKEKTISDKLQEHNFGSNVYSKQSMIRSSHSVPSLGTKDFKKSLIPSKDFHNDKRKVSVAILPSLQENKYFKPLEHNNHKNTYSEYLDKNKISQNPLSVFKNRITGYTNINTLKKPFHMLDNPEGTERNLNTYVTIKKQKTDQKQIQNIQQNKDQKENVTQNNVHSHLQQKMLKIQGKNHLNDEPYQKQTNKTRSNHAQQNKQSNVVTKERQEQKAEQSHLYKLPLKQIITKEISKKDDQKDKKKQVLRLPSLVKENIDQKEHREMINIIKQKLDVKDDDELLNQHLQIQQQKQREVNGRLIQVFKKYNFNDQ